MFMKREKLKKILLNYYKEPATNHILRGIRRPSYEKILAMHEKHQIPFDAWRDIKSYLREDDTKTKKSEQEFKGAKV